MDINNYTFILIGEISVLKDNVLRGGWLRYHITNITLMLTSLDLFNNETMVLSNQATRLPSF